MSQELNVDYGKKIAEFEAAMKKFKIKRIIYKRVFLGKGLEFDGYRLFNPDDDAGLIDWKASLRSNQKLVRQYIEERDLKIVFLVDVSDNMVFGSQEKLKCEYAAEICTALSHLIITSGDKVGGFLFNEKIAKRTGISGGLEQFQLFSYILKDSKNYGGRINFREVLDYINKILDDSISAVIIVSDFLKLKEDMLDKLKTFGNRFETFCVMIKDPLDRTLPDLNKRIVIEDPETEKQVQIDPQLLKKRYEKFALERENMIKDMFKKSNIDFVEISTDKNFIFPLVSFLKQRVRRKE